MKIKSLINNRIALFFVFLLSVPFLGADDNLVKVEHLYPGKVDVKTFRIDKKSDVSIYGKGAKLKKRSRNILCYGWIIDAKTGKVQWNSLKILKNKFLNETGIFAFEDDIAMEPGIYKAFYTAVYDNDGIVIKDLGDLVENIFSNWNEEDVFTFHEDELNMIIKGQKNIFQELDEDYKYVPESQKTVVAFYRTGENEYLEKSFSVNATIPLYIQSAGEKKDRKFYDYGRIYDMRNHEVIWPTKSTIFEYAGGGWKNVEARDEIKLPAGNYSVSYVTDDSHAYNEWNVMPPNNPEAWGIQVFCEASDINRIDFSTARPEPIVDLMKVGDNAILSQGMELKKTLELRVICLGEYNNGEAYDYGWIEDARTNEIVWKFTGRNSVHAGGGDKNRKFNGIVKLPEGQYIVKYISDGSHSYFDWNTTPPFEKEYWGISVWPLKENDEKYVSLINEQKLVNENIIVKIDRVGDHEERHKDFMIEKDGLYGVYAIGEGDDDEMYDTGWIKRLSDGQIVWEMTGRNSKWAGGARKNRMFNGDVFLKAGRYRLYFETDGSHSFADWNATPPTNPDKYGIRIMTK